MLFGRFSVHLYRYHPPEHMSSAPTARIVEDPANPDRRLVWCKTCVKHLPEALFYAKGVARCGATASRLTCVPRLQASAAGLACARSFFECKPCASKRMAATRKARGATSGGVRKPRAEAPLIPPDAQRALMQGEEVTMGAWVLNLQRQPAAQPAAA